jgi:hypothetical protein
MLTTQKSAVADFFNEICHEPTLGPVVDTRGTISVLRVTR